ncbi:MAG: hypothetical protein JNK85_28125, partial [Verrucomicrobiales bacterium]|nr:hypothetical protein [Verrucomicrobiales bacterium]
MKPVPQVQEKWRRYLRPPPPPPRDVPIFTWSMVVLGVVALVIVWSVLLWRDARSAMSRNSASVTA